MSYKKLLTKQDKKLHKQFRDSRKSGGSRGKLWQVSDKQG